MYVGRAKAAQFLRLAIHVLLKHDDLARFDPIFIKSLLAHQITVERQLADVVHAADVIILAPSVVYLLDTCATDLSTTSAMSRNEHPVAKKATVSAHFLASLTRLLP